MLIFGENINTINKDVASALASKNSDFFSELVKSQIGTGFVDVVDVNVGSFAEEEPGNMEWIIPVVEEVTRGEIPLSIDSSNPEAILTGIHILKNKKGAFINSITLEKSRYQDLIPVAKEHDLNIIGLPIDEKGVPPSAEERLALANKLVELLDKNKISPDRLYIDCIIEPISVSDDRASIALETLALLKKNIPEANTFICLTAVSFGLPNRRLLNSNFLTLLLKEEIDAVILNPLDVKIISNLLATNALLGKDFYCQNYLSFFRKKTSA